jgi:hypothetical protein
MGFQLAYERIDCQLNDTRSFLMLIESIVKLHVGRMLNVYGCEYYVCPLGQVWYGCLYHLSIPLVKIATWLILPVVIRSSQRLSHACLSINLLL